MLKNKDRITHEQFDSYKKQIIELISRYIPDVQIYLFGSRARKDSRMGSDVDLALDAGKIIDTSILIAIKDDIEESAIPFFVDVIDLHDVAQDFKNIIKKDMILWKN